MPFVKVVKNKAYFKRFQTKLRRRGEGKTDYNARRKMIMQDKNKYNSPKYRFVVRQSNTRIVCQIAYATIEGDRVVTQAVSTELGRYGVKVGLKNYAAAYCTGLLCARRCLKKLGLAEAFTGKEEADGEEYHVEEEENDRRPFKCVLDVGIKTTSSGANMWGALKGGVDGGLYIPHSAKLFPGYAAPEEKGAEPSYDAEAHKGRILGEHVKEYMEMLKEEDSSKYEAHFAKYIKEGLDGEGLEDMYLACHKKIRETPEATPKKVGPGKGKRNGVKITDPKGKTYTRSIKLSLKQRKEKVRLKIVAALEKRAAAGGDDDE